MANIKEYLKYCSDVIAPAAIARSYQPDYKGFPEFPDIDWTAQPSGVVLLYLNEDQRRKLSTFIRCLLPGSDAYFEEISDDIDGNKQCALKVVVSSDQTHP